MSMEVCKLQFIGEIDLCTFLSVSREKYQKSATQGRLRGASLTEPTACVRDSFAHGGAKESECAEERGHPIARTDGGAPSAINSPEARRETGNPSLQPREQAKPASSALRRGCGLPGIREVTAH